MVTAVSGVYDAERRATLRRSTLLKNALAEANGPEIGGGACAVDCSLGALRLNRPASGLACSSQSLRHAPADGARGIGHALGGHGGGVGRLAELLPRAHARGCLFRGAQGTTGRASGGTRVKATMQAEPAPRSTPKRGKGGSTSHRRDRRDVHRDALSNHKRSTKRMTDRFSKRFAHRRATGPSRPQPNNTRMTVSCHIRSVPRRVSRSTTKKRPPRASSPSLGITRRRKTRALLFPNI